MSSSSGRFWSNIPPRVVLAVLGVIIVTAAALLVAHSSTTSPAKATTAKGTSSKVQVPQLVGLPQAAALTLLQSAGLKSSVSTVPGSGLPGTILTQSPTAGSSVAPGTRVDLTASEGTSSPVIPDVSGQTIAQARATLNALGFPVKSLSHEHSSVPVGIVISTTPPAGSSVPANSTVELLVSRGPVKVAPPPTTRPHPAPVPRPAPTPTSPPTTPPTAPPPTQPPATTTAPTTS